MQVIVLSFVTAFTLTYFAIPPIIRIALAKNLVDEPDERRSHTVRTPSLGGIGIFSGSIFAIVLWTPFSQFGNLQYILCAFIILFLVGAKDDISPIPAKNKLIAQFIAASILALKSDIMLTSLYGLFGVYNELPFWTSYVLSVFFILVLINAFNLIDGINGLAGGIGILILGTLGCWFFLIGRLEFATLAFSSAGAIAAFLRYNFTPARIFMGDTGSLLIGVIIAILLIKFMDLNYLLSSGNPFRFANGPGVALGIAILPLFDTLRVFATRIIRGQSPLKPDRRHIHHLLIDYGLSHMQATGILVFVNAGFIVFVFTFHDLINVHFLVGFVLAIASGMTYALHKSVNRKNSGTVNPLLSA
ncbi:MAG: undecaprenyl/decaprenyl-phosphate alpha-N-acetylglucosaminyl 1-phosphate transferase [Haliscomenobacter sp.]|nr:undecaprenyl/decaprenyl-phosphate alpha-N-acetylglucosaminyl 1-phosphate transferase [Haliscomenobacter sp.]